MPRASNYHDDFELESLDGNEIEFLDPDDPDAPLPLHESPLSSSSTSYSRMEAFRPKWLQPNHPWPTRLLERATTLLQPRFTIGYIITTLLVLYIIYCCIIGSPLLASRLPKYTGPHDVGAIDLEVPVSEPRNIGDALLKNGEPAFQLDTVLFTLYYPAEKGSKSSRSRHKWFPRPINLIAEGYAKAAHFNNFFSRQLFTFALWGLAGSMEIPAKVDVPLSRDNEKQQFPVVVLSHGDVSSRTDYTAYCGELASRGVVVAAIEHRDGSCPGSIVNLPDGKQKKVLLFRADELQVPADSEEVSNDSWRFQKLAYRDAEIQETLQVLKLLNSKDSEAISSRNYRSEGKDFSTWTNSLDFSHTIIAGHSFGATGALQALKTANETGNKIWNPAIGGIILDPGKSSGRLNPNISVPLLIVHSASWSAAHTIFYGRPHFDTVRDIAKTVLDRCGATWFMTSLKTSHPSVTDAPLIEPLLLSWTTGATINVKEGLAQYVKVSMEFLDFLKNGKRGGVLNVGVTHEEYGKDSKTEEQKKGIEKEISKFWEVHVAPPAETEDN